VIAHERFISYRRRRDVKLYRFLLSLYSLIGTCTGVQNCTFRWPFKYGLFNDAVSDVDYIATNGWMTVNYEFGRI
jgi:hypothetical protein